MLYLKNIEEKKVLDWFDEVKDSNDPITLSKDTIIYSPLGLAL